MKDWKLVNFCEFDKYATKSYCAIHNVDESLNLGDINEVDENNLQPFTMICGGSPCQDFSVAGEQKGSIWTCKDCLDEEAKPFQYNPLTVHWSKRNKCPHCGSENVEKTRSSLLVEYLRVIRANKPNFGMYENVKNIVGKKFKETTFKLFEEELHEYGYNTYWKVLNAKDYGVPQNRERVYLIFIKKELDNGKFVFPEGFDNGIRLRDVLEEEVDEKYYISEEKVKKFIANLQENETEDESNSPKFIGNINRPDFGTGYAGGVWDTNNISPTLTTMQGGGRQPHIMCEIDKSLNSTKFIENANCLTAREDRGISNRKSEGTAVLEVLGNVNPSGRGMNGNVFSDEGLAPTLTTNKGEGNKVAIHETQPKERFFKQALETLENAEVNYGDTVDAFNKRVNKSGYSPTLTTRPEGFKTVILPVTNNLRIRKLTPKECFRLMGFEDSAYEAVSKLVSNSQMYKQTGNSIVVDVLYYILVELYTAMPYLFDDLRLSSFFSGIGAFEIALDRLYEGINTGNFTRPQVD